MQHEMKNKISESLLFYNLKLHSDRCLNVFGTNNVRTEIDF